MVKRQAALLLVALFMMGACSLSPGSTTGYARTDGKTAGSPAASAVAPARVALGEIRLTMEPGASMGARYDEFGAVLGEPFAAPDALSPEQQRRFREAILRAMTQRGIAIVSRDEAVGLDASWRAPRLLQVSIADLRTEIRRGASREEIAASLRVEWEIFDRESGEALFLGSSFGQSLGEASAVDAQVAAMGDAAGSLLQKAKSVVTALTEIATTAVLPAAFGPGVPIEIAPLQPDRPMPASPEAMLQAAAGSVFSIRNPAGHGSGFFIRQDGLALTSRHVIEGRKYWDAFLADGRSVRMQVLREDRACDVALLKASGEGSFVPIPLGDSGALRLGEEIWAIGTPVSLTLSQSVSRGIVSALRVEAQRTLVQTDAALNPGSSGGPVLNRAGQAIGIANLKLRARDVEGIAFCTAIHDARAALQLFHR